MPERELPRVLAQPRELAPVLMRAVVLSCLVLALAGCGGSGGGSNSQATPTTAAETATAQSAEPVAWTAEDCATLGTVLSDVKVDSHTDWNFAYDIFPTDFQRDRDALGSLSGSTSSGVAADDLAQLRAFIDAYAPAAQAAGVEEGTMPATQDQASTVWQSLHAAGVDSLELRPAIRTLTSWAAGGCSDSGPPSETTTSTSETPTNPVAKASADAAVGDSVEEVTAAVNEVMSRRTEEPDFGEAPLGYTVRNCRKERDLSVNSLIAPGGTAYICEVYDGDRHAADGPAIVDVDGNVVTTP